MDQWVGALTTAWGLAAFLFAGAAIAAAVLIRGPARAAAASLSALVAIALFIAGASQVPRSEEAAPAQTTAARTTDAPRADRDAAAALMTQAAREANMGQTEAARKTYERARQSYRAAKDVLGEASVVLGEGRLEHMIGQSARARQSYSAALALYQQGGSPIGVARVYASMGDLEKDTFQWAKASEYYALARQQWQRAPEPKSDPHVLLGIEDAPLLRNGEERTRAALDQARKIYDQLGDKVGLADIALITAQLEFRLGRVDLARALFADARSLFNAAGDKDREADANLQIAAIDIRRGFNRQAVESLEQSRALFTAAGNAAGVGRAAIAFGDLERLQGRLEMARKQYADAAAALAPSGNRAEAEALRKLGQLELFGGNPAAARVSLERAIAAAQRSGWKEEEAIARVAAAATAREMGDTDAANQHGQAANVLFAQSRNAEGRARAALALASDANGFRDGAQRMTDAHLLLGVVEAQLGLGDALRAGGNSADAAVAYRTAEQAWNGITNKVAEANRLLDLPPVDAVYIIPPPATNFYENPDAHPEDVEPDPILVKANIDEFPDHNIEARTLVERVEKRLAAALEPPRGR